MKISDAEYFRNKRILVTGAAGFLASHMVFAFDHLNKSRNLGLKLLLNFRNPAKAEKRFGREVLSEKNVDTLVCDVNDMHEIGGDVDIIVHAASLASPRYYKDSPLETALPNVVGHLNLLRIAREKKARYLFLSSGEVYGQSNADQIREEDFGLLDPAQVRACYAESKRFGETLSRIFVEKYDVKVTNVRPFHTYGPGIDLDDGRVYCDFVKNVVQNRNVEIFSDGSAVRAYCYVADAIQGFLLALIKGTPGESYNIGNPAGAMSVRELAETLVGLFPKKKLSVEYKSRSTGNYLPSTIAKNVPDIKKAENELEWSPKTSVAEGFRKTILSFEEGI